MKRPPPAAPVLALDISTPCCRSDGGPHIAPPRGNNDHVHTHATILKHIKLWTLQGGLDGALGIRAKVPVLMSNLEKGDNEEVRSRGRENTSSRPGTRRACRRNRLGKRVRLLQKRYPPRSTRRRQGTNRRGKRESGACWRRNRRRRTSA